MFKILSKSLFFIFMILGTFITISSNSWFGMWMGLEINLVSFIPLMIYTNNMMSSEASLKYFITQAFASMILIFSVMIFMLMNNMIFQLNILFTNYYQYMIYITLMIKLGMAPFHFWFPNVMEGLTWYNCMILMTWQKIAPMIILSYLSFKQFFIFFIILSILLSSIGGLNQTSLRKIMAFSSINHMSWMLSALMFNESLWMLYFLIYSIMTFSMIFLFNEFKLFYLNQMFSIFSLFYYLKFFFMINFLSLGGLPPFMGFLPKWMIIQSLISLNQNLFILIMIMMTLIILYFYLRISYSAFMLNYESTNWLFNNQFKNKTMILLSIFSFFSISGLFIFILLMYNFY